MEMPDGEPDGLKSLGMKFNVSKSKSQRKVAVNLVEQSDNKVLITGVEGSTIVAAAAPEQRQANAPFVIPKIENTYNTGGGRKFTPTFVPPAHDAPCVGAGEDRFVAAAPTAPLITEYGLTQRLRPGDPAGQQQQQGSITQRLTEEQQFKQDVEALPEQATLEVGTGSG